MPNRLFYTVKLSSSLLKEYKYNLSSITFDDCLRSNLIVSLSDSQMLSSIRDLTNNHPDLNLLESYYAERDHLKKSKNLTPLKRARIKTLQSLIYSTMYIPEYITVTMESAKDYERMFHKGFVFMNRTYRRLSCSASQARVSTIVFVDETILEPLTTRLNNGRDLSHPLAPSKFNAYFGLYSSASKPVTTPRFCIVPDYFSSQPVQTSWSIENPDWDVDDTIEERTVQTEFNRFDGSGLISPQMASQWAQDLAESYTPCQFCIRTAFTKGLLNVFDFVTWCTDEIQSYTITDIYGNTVDLRNIDVILTEGMAKLWDSWPSQASFEQNCLANNISWRVTKYSPKQDKTASTLNYQYIQTLKDTLDIPALCQDTVSYIQGVSLDNPYYALLFSIGQTDIQSYMDSSDNYWLKSMVLNPSLLNDRYSREKLRDTIVTKIEQACLGRIFVRGNYQAIVPDPFALMQWITKQPVTGILADGEFYSQFWHSHNVSTFACARSPQTYRSEWLTVHNATSPQIEKYFAHSYSGIITNIHGQYTLNFAGSDFDFDILFTTDNPQILSNIYTDELVTAYDVPKPKKKPNLTPEDLFLSDTFSFGQQIGPLTNISTTIYALLPLFPPDSQEHSILVSRLKQCCVNQSKQIDKTKLGQPVKCIPKIWNTFQHITPTDTPSEIENKLLMNRIIADKKPYFFRYKYDHLNKELNAFIRQQEQSCQRLFSKSLTQLLATPSPTPQESNFLEVYHKLYPVLDTPCTMNNLCKYIESIDFSLKQKIKTTSTFDYHTLLSPSFTPDSTTYAKLDTALISAFKSWKEQVRAKQQTHLERSLSDSKSQTKFERETECALLKQTLLSIEPDEFNLANYLILLFYKEHPSYSKTTLWTLSGKEIYSNMPQTSYSYPVPDPAGTFTFLYDTYSIQTFERTTAYD